MIGKVSEISFNLSSLLAVDRPIIADRNRTGKLNFGNIAIVRSPTVAHAAIVGYIKPQWSGHPAT
ncbi:hypothetical protein [Rhizobium binxianense]|uniref:hypothetical protein n=1 Tax=Rhizobium binxianense TaxID=3024242 RepID=UPI00234F22FE|nr:MULTISPECIES: hypothetical protein [unclassified Rhizobium]MDC7741921.1 hypothetical protein [Rhizobium sp. BC56]MDC9833655.1 hypothetical protein [Rhizobium sp. MJ37]